ncbi:E3 ubiquitin ligase PQT3-like [Iris pallida]|uniref:E3 ubiquitin ligase PQT3-like n=1 Tax=Iris pallida TaxID=29817 RepID=A0AAX6DNZ4_IRIPA|nr:E3 ubiquitin ligase PQT3-like [Iris pallida]
MAIYFRFKSRKDFESIAVPGKYVRIGDLKDRIRKDRGLLRDFDVLLYNPQTGQGRVGLTNFNFN